MAGMQFSRRVLARTVAAKLAHEPTRQEYWMQVLAAYLIEQKRTGEADLLVTDIERELHVQAGILSAKVTSARPLSDALRSTLTKMLTVQTQAKRVVLAEEINPGLIGGLVARTPDAELDASVRTTLQRIATIN